jgi:transcriptional regulator with XRE-family HTH domain
MAKSKADKWLTQDKLTLLRAWARDGLTDEQIAKNMGISVATLYNYKKNEKYLDILEALKKGKEVVDIEVENALLKKAMGFREKEQVVQTKRVVKYKDGKRVSETSEPVVIEIDKYYPPETLAIIYWLKNRRLDLWRDKIERNDNEEEIQNAKDIVAKIRKSIDG